jgi:hypothetical protein
MLSVKRDDHDHEVCQSQRTLTCEMVFLSSKSSEHTQSPDRELLKKLTPGLSVAQTTHDQTGRDVEYLSSEGMVSLLISSDRK